MAEEVATVHIRIAGAMSRCPMRPPSWSAEPIWVSSRVSLPLRCIHSHPHRDEEFTLPDAMRERAALAMEHLQKTLVAAGCSLADIVSATRYLTDVREQDDLNQVWA
jgi:enamine deaminase RidA (YjgF/YER057c/UK114 family)